MKVRKLNISDAEAFRDLRLGALKESPTAFGMSYDEYLKTSSSLKTVAERLETSTGYVLGAFEEGGLIGVIGLNFGKGIKRSHITEIWGSM